MVGLREAGVDVAEADPPAVMALVDEVVGAVRLDRRRAVGERLLDVEDGRKVLVVDPHGGGALQRRLLAGRDDRDDRLAAVQHAVLGQHRLVVRLHPDQAEDRVPVGRHVLVREHPQHARHLERGREVHRLEQRVVALGAVHLEVEHSRRVDVLEELRSPGHVPERVRALHGLADHVEVVPGVVCLEVRPVDALGLQCHRHASWATATAARRRAAASRIALMIDS